MCSESARSQSCPPRLPNSRTFGANLNRRLNDRFDAFRNQARPYRSSCPKGQKHRHPPIFAEEPDQPIEMRDADPEFRGSLSNSRSSDHPRPLLCDQASNFFFPTASFLPVLLGDLGRLVMLPPCTHRACAANP